MERTEIEQILKKHTRWLLGEEGGERGNLRGEDLRYANLSCADLSYADLSYANLSCAIGIALACPSEGAFTAWKKANYSNGKKCIIKLEIPSDAKRSSATSTKCRCDKAKVIGFYDLDGKELDIDFATSNYDRTFAYKIGETVSVPNFDEDRWNECAAGIHFFVDKQMAINY